MSFSYVPGALAENGKDRVRFELGDDDWNDPLLEDEEIELCLADSPTWQAAVAKAAGIVETRFRRQIDKSLGSLRIEFSKRADAWAKVRERYESLAAGGQAGSFTGMGLSAGGLPTCTYYSIKMHDYSTNGYPHAESQ